MTRFRWLAPLVAVLLLAGCSSMPNAADQSQQDLEQPTKPPPPPSPADVQAASDRPLPYPQDPEPGFMEAVQNGTRTTTGRPGKSYWTQEVDYDIDATVFADEKRVEAVAAITYTNNSPDTLDELHVELAQNLHKEGVNRIVPNEVTGGMELSRVAVSGTELSRAGNQSGDGGPRYRVSGTQLVITPPESIASGESVSMTIAYRFTIPQQGASGRIGYDGDDLIYVGYWYPQVSVYDDVAGWMTDDFLGLAEFYADFSDFDLKIRAPERWIVQSTGRLQNVDEVLTDAAAERRSRAYQSDEPVMIAEPGQTVTRDVESDTLTWRYTAERVRDVAFSMTTGNWEAARTPIGDRDGDGETDHARINTFWRDSAPKWAEVTKYQQHSLRFLSEYTGLAYPYPHMTAVEGGGIIGGGMEFPMMTIMGDYNDNTARMLYAVTAHELAHMWVPMIVNTNERRYSWIDEGTTSFHENVARKDYFDDSESIESDRKDYVQFARSQQRAPIMRWSNYHYSGQAFGIASYRKPATLLAALRGLLGEATFDDAIQTFVDDWKYKHPYPTDFFNTFERVSGRELDWFWYSFYYTDWTLDQAIASVDTSGDRVEVTVRDDGRAMMPVRLTVTLDDGSTLQREIPVDVWLRGRTSATTTINVDGDAVERIEIDAAHHFPDVDRDNNVWTR